jgi:DNA-binding response OmpR family regulator
MNVLIADEHLTTRETVALHLKNAGHRVHAAKDGKEALGLLEEHRPDVALLDLNLLDISAFAIAKLTRDKADFNHTRLVAFSGEMDTASWDRAAEAGFDYVLNKPVSPDQIDAFLRAPRPEDLFGASIALRKRSAEILKKSESLSKRAAAARARAGVLLGRNQFRVVTPNKLNLAVSKHAKTFGYSRVCFVVVRLEAGQVAHTDQHFATASAAKHYARNHCQNGYFYTLNQRQTAKGTELFPSLEQVQNYLDHGSFLQ